MTGRAELLDRLDVAEERLAALAALASPQSALTDPDPRSGERWDSGQIWAHLAEFVPYWIDQAQNVASSYADEPVPFGRIASDAARVGAIERDRSQPTSVLWSDTHADIEALRRFLATLDERDWTARGVHPTRGVMSMDHIVEEFLVGHLEEHADQLSALTV